MFKKVMVFSCQHRLLHLSGNLIERYHASVFITFHCGDNMIEPVINLNRFNWLITLEQSDIRQILHLCPQRRAKITAAQSNDNKYSPEGSLENGSQRRLLFSSL